MMAELRSQSSFKGIGSFNFTLKGKKNDQKIDKM